MCNCIETDPWASYDRMFSPEYEGEREAARRRKEGEEQAAIERWEAEREERGALREENEKLKNQ